ncbi:MAG: hypothetical protein J7L08_02600, partial [Candidatus Aenigmarchaeota archaeon]|nr:hypothetical protein [Candidatus Aenigmarchaeota archaeon]
MKKSAIKGVFDKDGKKAISLLITVFVVALLVFSGPASAVTVNLIRTDSSDDDGVYNYKAVIDIHTNDIIPLDLIAIRLTNLNESEEDSGMVDYCYFNFDDHQLNDTYGSDLEGPCKMINITDVVNHAVYKGTGGTGYGYGYGYEPGWGVSNVTWSQYGYGYNYGYGYADYTAQVSTQGEVIIYFTVDTTVHNGPMNGTGFNMKAGIAGIDESNPGNVKFTYYNKEDKVFVVKGGEGGPEIYVRKDTSSGEHTFEIGDTIEYTINITNIADYNLTSIILNDSYDVDLNFTSERAIIGSSECTIDNHVQPVREESGQPGHFIINVTECGGGPLPVGDSYIINLNFTAVMSAQQVGNEVHVYANDTEGNSYEEESGVSVGITGEGGEFDGGIQIWNSKVESPYVIQNEPKMLNFTIYRDASPESCLNW